MRIFKQISVVAFALLLCIVLFVQLLTRVADDWESSITPLSMEEIGRFSLATANDADNAENKDDAQAEEPVDNHGTLGEERTVTSANPSDTLPENKDAKQHVLNLARLSSQPTEEQLRHRFVYNHLSDIELLQEKARVRTQRLCCAAIYHFAWDKTHESIRSIPGGIGRTYLRTGDFDRARNFLREAVRVEEDEQARTYFCAHLAWLEEDPQVAVALIEESCAGPMYEGEIFEGYAQLNALSFAVGTGNEALAEYYFQRDRDLWQEIEGVPWLPEACTWLEELLGEPEAPATQEKSAQI